MRISTKREIKEFHDDDQISERCCHCKELKTTLHLISNQHTKIIVCINPKCFLYKELTRLITWQR